MRRATSTSIFVYLAISLIAGTAFAQNGTVDLPQVLVDTTYPTQTGTLRTVCASGCTHASLQAAIDAAARGDTIRVSPAMTITGPITLRAKSGTGWIVIRSSSTAFDTGGVIPLGRRATPNDTGLMPTIQSTSSPNIRAINSENGASYYRLVGLHIKANDAQTLNSTIVELGTATTSVHHVVIDRSYIHGRDVSPVEIQRGVALNGTHMAVIDSTIDSLRSGTPDAQAIGSFHGAGPFKIHNNTLEGQHESVMFGGSDPSTVNLVASDIEITNNLLTRRASWASVTQKNQLELKNARRVLIANNIIEYTYQGGQAGHALVFKPTNQNGGCTWCSMVDVTFRHNLVRHAAGAVKIADPASPQDTPDGEYGDVLIEHNVFDHIDGDAFSSVAARTIMISNAPENIVIRNNTFLNVNTSHAILFEDGTMITGFTFSRNLIRSGTYGVKGDPAAGWTSINAHATGAVFAQNGIGDFTSGCGTAYAGNLCPTATQWESQFVSYGGGNGGDYHLVSGNIYDTQWPGVLVGADIDQVMAAVECVESGDPSESEGCSGSAPPAWSLSDAFTSSLASFWTIGVISGVNNDPSISIGSSGGRLQIGPLPTSTAGYRGVYTTNAVDFTGAFAQVRIVQAASGADDFTMFAVVRNASNYYRVHVNGGSLVAEKEIANVKSTLDTQAYSGTNHARVRIKHEAGNVLFQTSPDGTAWTTAHAEAWDEVAIPLNAVKLEIKTGASDVDSTPSRVALYDDFLAAKP